MRQVAADRCRSFVWVGIQVATQLRFGNGSFRGPVCPKTLRVLVASTLSMGRSSIWWVASLLTGPEGRQLTWRSAQLAEWHICIYVSKRSLVSLCVRIDHLGRFDGTRYLMGHLCVGQYWFEWAHFYRNVAYLYRIYRLVWFGEHFASWIRHTQGHI